MLQAYVPELVAQGEYSLIFIEGRCTHAVRKVAASGEFRVNWEFGGRQVFMESGEAPEAGLATATRMWEWLSEKLRSEGTGEELMYMRLDGAIREDGEFVVIGRSIRCLFCSLWKIVLHALYNSVTPV